MPYFCQLCALVAEGGRRFFRTHAHMPKKKKLVPWYSTHFLFRFCLRRFFSRTVQIYLPLASPSYKKSKACPVDPFIGPQSVPLWGRSTQNLSSLSLKTGLQFWPWRVKTRPTFFGGRIMSNSLRIALTVSHGCITRMMRRDTVWDEISGRFARKERVPTDREAVVVLAYIVPVG